MEGGMSKVHWLVLTSIAGLAMFFATAPARAQYAEQVAPASRSVLKRADHVEWSGGYGTVAGPGISGCNQAHVGCGGGVCYGYDNCCNPCCCRPLRCVLGKIVRTLDCLLPCGHYGHGGCGGCGLFAGCRPHLFHRGHCGLGGRCGGCDVGCTTPSCTAPSCTTPVGHSFDNPVYDEPVAPKPMPETSKDIGYRQARVPHTIRDTSPFKVTTPSEVSRQEAIEMSIRSGTATPVNPRDKVAVHTTLKTMSGGAPPRPAAPSERGVAPALHLYDDAPAASPVAGDDSPHECRVAGRRRRNPAQPTPSLAAAAPSPVTFLGSQPFRTPSDRLAFFVRQNNPTRQRGRAATMSVCSAY